MKLQYILLLLLLCTPVLALDSITDFVHDEADILNASLEAELRDVLGGMAREGVVEMAVVTINSLEGESKEEYALRLAHDKLGDKEEDNGLLLLIALEEQEYRVEVGYGLEGVLNDAKVGRFAREFLVPSFKEGKYDEGVAIFTNAVLGELTGEPVDDTLLGKYEVRGVNQDIIRIVFFIVIWIIYMIICRKCNKGRGGIIFIPGFGSGGSGGFGGFGGGGFGGGGGGGRW